MRGFSLLLCITIAALAQSCCGPAATEKEIAQLKGKREGRGDGRCEGQHKQSGPWVASARAVRNQPPTPLPPPASSNGANRDYLLLFRETDRKRDTPIPAGQPEISLG